MSDHKSYSLKGNTKPELMQRNIGFCIGLKWKMENPRNPAVSEQGLHSLIYKQFELFPVFLAAFEGGGMHRVERQLGVEYCLSERKKKASGRSFHQE